MLRTSTSNLLRRGRAKSLAFAAYTENDAKTMKNVSDLHVGRLKHYIPDDIELDGKLNTEYSMDKNKTFTEQQKLVEKTEEPDQLFHHIDILVGAHDNPVLNSYVKYMQIACKELEIKTDCMQIKPIYMRRQLLKSAHVHKKWRVNYEIRDYRQVLRLYRLTGTSANVVLEYFQRNIPAGVMMQVNKFEMLEAPENVKIKAPDSGEIERFELKERDYELYQTSRPYVESWF